MRRRIKTGRCQTITLKDHQPPINAECAGINRHGIGNERVLQERNREPSRPTGAQAGRVLNCEINFVRGPTLFCEAEGNNMGDDTRELSVNPAQSETPGMPGNSTRENRETPLASGSGTPDRLEKATSYTTSMHAGGESDQRVVCAEQRVVQEG